MTFKPLIAVFGATGLQGGSVARYLLQDGGFSVRALTSNTNSERAKSLVSIHSKYRVSIDLYVKSSLEFAEDGRNGGIAIGLVEMGPDLAGGRLRLDVLLEVTGNAKAHDTHDT